MCLCYKKNSRWHLQTNFPVQFSTQINTLLRSTALLYSTRVFLVLPASLPASPVSCLPHSLYTLPLFSPAWSRHLLPLIIHTSVKLPSLSHLFCSSSRFILFHLLVPTSLLRPHAHHTPEVIIWDKKVRGWQIHERNICPMANSCSPPSGSGFRNQHKCEQIHNTFSQMLANSCYFL